MSASQPPPFPYSESALTFPCRGETLVGIVARPAMATEPATGVAVLIVVGGPQYRVGSHRQFVLLARALAAHGTASLRFDVRGMGDSTGQAKGFEDLTDDIAAAADALTAALPGVAGIVLWGLCDGASAALLYVARGTDSRIRGLCLLNPWVRSEQTLARTHVQHYYGRRLLDGSFWRKLIQGGIGMTALRGLARAVSLAQEGSADVLTSDVSDFRHRMAQGVAVFAGPVLLVLSGNDFTAREFLHHVEQQPIWQHAMAGTRVHRLDLPDADHTLSSRADDQALQQAMIGWLRNSVPSPT